MKNIDSLIFALLTRQKIAIIGSDKEIDKVSTNLNNFLPDEIKNFISKNAEFIIKRPPTDETMQMLDKKRGKLTIVFLPTNEVYGQYTSIFCKKIASLYTKENFSKIKEELASFYHQAIEDEEIIRPAEYAVGHGIPKADASLLMWIRALHFNKNVDQNIFDNSEW